VRFHDLRHFFVSNVAPLLPEAIRLQLVGQTDERTHRSYTRPIEGTEKMIREALSQAFES